MFITFDGPNGAGKSTVIEELAKYLAFKEKQVYITKEPTETEIGKYIRESEEKYASYTLANLVAADRHNHIKKEIVPYINKGHIVLCDRYIPSSLILQVLDGLSMSEVMSINTGFLKPDLSVIVYANESTISERLSDRSTLTRFERDFSSEREIELSFKAGKYLEELGYKIEYIDTDESLVKNIEKLGDMIMVAVS
ncbi:Thymidylate kinase [Petrocella atlantisensis]|uniref:Thymidylate kinase n=1 Tax=Petrocella atlantisensis TaxID=2173034 RepID=A0A3P7PCV5_9FIRM|nr:dTMP kinase [Petrocella atlantisensis]VDN47893.1 Thymidylate kinase [Petrocella atlantisensis]